MFSNKIKLICKLVRRPFSTNLNSNLRNITPNIEDKINRKLWLQKNHPLNILRNKIVSFFDEENKHKYSKLNVKTQDFTLKEDLSPIVSLKECFDDLLVPSDHETRSPKNTYYWDDNQVLRTHMTAHDVGFIQNDITSFISIGDVYRRDSIDGTHYPVFHQVDAVRLFDTKELTNNPYSSQNTHTDIIKEDLKYFLENFIHHLFGKVEMRWVDAYFPFTEPSLELEIFFNNNWLEVLGCGVLRDGVVAKSGKNPELLKGWAFGIGLERLAMKLFNISDIRLFWSNDERFIKQFKDDKIVSFKPYSKYPTCYKDISFYVPSDFNENDFFEVIRNAAGDLVEDVKCVDTFENKKNNKISKCFRILYRSMDRSLTNSEIDILQFKIRDMIHNEMKLELR